MPQMGGRGIPPSAYKDKAKGTKQPGEPQQTANRCLVGYRRIVPVGIPLCEKSFDVVGIDGTL